MFRAKAIVIHAILALTGAGMLYGVALPDIRFSISGSEMFSEENATHTFTITKLGNASMAGTVDFEFSGNAGYGEDYSNIAGDASVVSGTLTFASGETSKIITVDIIDDLLDELPMELINVKLSNPTAVGGTARLVLLGTIAIKTIIDNDPQPQVTLSLAGGTMAEKGGIATVTATLSEVSARYVMITLRFSGTASGSDYTASSIMIPIAPGATQGSMTLTGIDDLLDDDNETIVVDIFLSINADEDGQQQVVAVIANEPPGLSKIPDVFVQEDQHSEKIQFQVFDEDDPLSSLRVFGWAENKTLIPDDAFTFYGEGADRAFRVTPAANQTGKTKSWIKVFDGTSWASRSFMITVTEKNDPPGPGEETEPVVFFEDETDSLLISPYIHDPDNDPTELRWKVTVAQDSGQSGEPEELVSAYKSFFVIFEEGVLVQSLLKDTSQTDTWVVIPEDQVPAGLTGSDTLRIADLEAVNGLYVSIVRATTETFLYGSPDFYDTQIPLLFTATDPSGGSFSFRIIVTITPVNDAPVFLEPLPEVSLMTGETKQVEWGLLSHVEDIDNEPGELSFQVLGSEHIHATLNADTLVLTAASDWTGTESLQLIVSDGELTDTTDCEITVDAAVRSERMEMTGVDGQIVPSEYSLGANYPNPFNPTTSIEYAVPRQTHVTITVYNAIGQAVEVLVDTSREPGVYSVNWNAGSLSSGIYFYQIQAEGFQQMRRCVFLK